MLASPALVRPRMFHCVFQPGFVYPVVCLSLDPWVACEWCCSEHGRTDQSLLWIPLAVYPAMGLLSPMVYSVLFFVELPFCFPHGPHCFTFPPARLEGFHFLQDLTSTCYFLGFFLFVFFFFFLSTCIGHEDNILYLVYLLILFSPGCSKAVTLLCGGGEG